MKTFHDTRCPYRPEPNRRVLHALKSKRLMRKVSKIRTNTCDQRCMECISFEKQQESSTSQAEGRNGTRSEFEIFKDRYPRLLVGMHLLMREGEATRKRFQNRNYRFNNLGSSKVSRMHQQTSAQSDAKLINLARELSVKLISTIRNIRVH